MSLRLVPEGLTLTIDAGRHTGWAIWAESTLTRCGLVDSDSACLELHMPQCFDRVVIEIPCFQKGDSSKRVNDILVTARRGGYILGRLRPGPNVEIHYIDPHSWKGSVEKAVHNQRTRDRLTIEELGILATARIPPSLINNTLDAIGIGLVTLGRW